MTRLRQLVLPELVGPETAQSVCLRRIVQSSTLWILPGGFANVAMVRDLFDHVTFLDPQSGVMSQGYGFAGSVIAMPLPE